jgi:hypothetical protein
MDGATAVLADCQRGIGHLLLNLKVTMTTSASIYVDAHSFSPLRN